MPHKLDIAGGPARDTASGRPPSVVIGIPCLLRGGTEAHVAALTRALADSGWRVTVCCYFEHDEEIVEQVRAAGASVVLLGCARRRAKFEPVALLRFFRRFRAFLEEQRPHVVHVQYLAPGLAAILAARAAAAHRVVATVHIAGARVYGLWARVLLRLAARFCDVFFCVSRGVECFWFGSSAELAASAVPLSSRRHWTVYNGVDVGGLWAVAEQARRDQAARPRPRDLGPVVGFVGRLAEQKGVSVLLEAFSRVRDRFPSAELWIVGDGPERDSLRGRCDALDLAGAVIFAGSVTASDVPRWMAGFDVLVVPSLYEGFGLVAAEGQAVGVPVVVTNVEGLNEVVEDGASGLVCPPFDSAALAEAIGRVLGDQALARSLATQAREQVAERFSRAAFGRTMVAAFRELLP